jgi:hypothetical protein
MAELLVDSASDLHPRRRFGRSMPEGGVGLTNGLNEDAQFFSGQRWNTTFGQTLLCHQSYVTYVAR